ncbi:MAG: sugar phosphate isomerase/epimerase family protein [Mesorhizobium sp.]
MPDNSPAPLDPALLTRWAPRLGCTTATFSSPLRDKLSAMRAAGFTSTEFWPRDLFEDPRGPDFSRAHLTESGLSVSCYQALRDYEGLPDDSREHVLNIAEMMMTQMQWVGSDVLIMCSNVSPDAVYDRALVLKQFERMAEQARRRGVKIALEPIGWARHIWDYRMAWSLVRELDHDHFGIMLDSLHIFSHNLPLDTIDEMDPAKILLVELADMPGTNLPMLEVGRHYRLFPGEGQGPVVDFLRRLEGIGYQGVYSVEIMNDHYARCAPAEVAERAMRTALQALSQVHG